MILLQQAEECRRRLDCRSMPGRFRYCEQSGHESDCCRIRILGKKRHGHQNGQLLKPSRHRQADCLEVSPARISMSRIFAPCFHWPLSRTRLRRTFRHSGIERSGSCRIVHRNFEADSMRHFSAVVPARARIDGQKILWINLMTQLQPLPTLGVHADRNLVLNCKHLDARVICVPARSGAQGSERMQMNYLRPVSPQRLGCREVLEAHAEGMQNRIHQHRLPY